MACEVYFNNLPKEEIDKLRENTKKYDYIDFGRRIYSTKYEILFNLQSLKRPKQLIHKFVWNKLDTFYGFLLFNIITLCTAIEQEFDVNFVKSFDNDDLYFCGRQFASVSKNYININDLAKVYTNNILDYLLNNKTLNIEGVKDILEDLQVEIIENRTYYYLNKFNDYKEISD